MTQRTFEFRPPLWRPPARLHHQTGTLFLITLAWLLVYAGLGWRLLAGGAVQFGPVEAALALIAVALGVGVLLGWRALLRRWTRQVDRRAWPALDLAALRDLSPAEFEDYVGQRLFARQGYTVHNTPDVKDGGVDILVTDVHGRRAVVQCKRYRGTVGEATVRDLYGTMMHWQATMAFLVTTGAMSESARRWAAGKPMLLIDGNQLVALAQSEASLAG